MSPLGPPCTALSCTHSPRARVVVRVHRHVWPYAPPSVCQGVWTGSVMRRVGPVSRRPRLCDLCAGYCERLPAGLTELNPVADALALHTDIFDELADTFDEPAAAPRRAASAKKRGNQRRAQSRARHP